MCNCATEDAMKCCLLFFPEYIPERLAWVKYLSLTSLIHFVLWVLRPTFSGIQLSKITLFLRTIIVDTLFVNVWSDGMWAKSDEISLNSNALVFVTTQEIPQNSIVLSEHFFLQSLIRLSDGKFQSIDCHDFYSQIFLTRLAIWWSWF